MKNLDPRTGYGNLHHAACVCSDCDFALLCADAKARQSNDQPASGLRVRR